MRSGKALTGNDDQITYICSIPAVSRLNLLDARRYHGERDCFFEYVPDGAIARLQIGDIDFVGFPAHTKTGHKAFSRKVDGDGLAAFLERHSEKVLNGDTAVNFGWKNGDLYLVVDGVEHCLTQEYVPEEQIEAQLVQDLQISMFLSELAFGNPMVDYVIHGNKLIVGVSTSQDKTDVYKFSVAEDGKTIIARYQDNQYHFRNTGIELVFKVLNLIKGGEI